MKNKSKNINLTKFKKQQKMNYQLLQVGRGNLDDGNSSAGVPTTTSSAQKKRDAERQRRHSRGWIASPEQTSTTNSSRQRQQQQAHTPGSNSNMSTAGTPFAAPLYGQPQARSDLDTGSGIRGAPLPPRDVRSDPPKSFGSGGVLGVLREDLKRLNSYFEFNEQRSFAFQQRYGSIDLRALSRIDLHDVVEAVDVQVLQGIMTNVTFSNVRERDLPLFSDHAMVKLIRVLQYSVEYLMNVQNTLLSNLDDYSERNISLVDILKEERSEKEYVDNKYRSLKKFAKQQKKSLQLYEAMLMAGSAGTYEAAQAVAQQRQLLRREARRAAKYAARREDRKRRRGGGERGGGERGGRRGGEEEGEEDDEWRSDGEEEEQNNNNNNNQGTSSSTRRPGQKVVRTTAFSATTVTPSSQAAAAAAAAAATAATQDMTSVLDEIHRKHYQEQLDMVHAQLALAEAEAERQAAAARDTRADKARMHTESLQQQMVLLEAANKVEIEKANVALAALRKRKKKERENQLRRVLTRWSQQTMSFGFTKWRSFVQDTEHERLRRERERARQEAMEQASKYDTLLARQKAASDRRRAARAKLMKRYANDEAQMNSIIRRYISAKQKGEIGRDHQLLMDQIETKAMLAVQKGATTAGLLRAKVEKSMPGPEDLHRPIPKHPEVTSRWGE